MGREIPGSRYERPGMTGANQPRLGLFEDGLGLNRFFKSLRPSESLGQSQENEGCAQVAVFARGLTLFGAAACGLAVGLATLRVVTGAFSFPLSNAACCNCCCCCFAENAVAIEL